MTLDAARLCLALGLFTASGSLAQIDMGGDFPVMDWLTPVIDSQRFGALLRSNLGLDDHGNTQAATNKSAVPATLRYVPGPALKKATVDGYVSRLKTKNPAASQALAANFGPGKYDYATIYSGVVKGNGLNDNDAVDVMTAYMVLGYMIVNNMQNGNAVTPAMVGKVRAQFAPGLAGNVKLSAPGVAAQLGEELKLQTVIVQGGWQSAIKEGTLSAYQQGIGALFKSQWGLDFAALKLTNQGFSSK